jgi:hypothetical protein
VTPGAYYCQETKGGGGEPRGGERDLSSRQMILFVS